MIFYKLYCYDSISETKEDLVNGNFDEQINNTEDIIDENASEDENLKPRGKRKRKQEVKRNSYPCDQCSHVSTVASKLKRHKQIIHSDITQDSSDKGKLEMKINTKKIN